MTALLKEGAHLTPREAEVLECLVRGRGRLLRGPEIYKAVWGTDLSRSSNALPAIISQVRRKLMQPDRLRTVRGLGYVMSPRED